MNKRPEILKSISEASRLFNRFPLGNRTSFNIMGAVASLEIKYLFKRLDKLYGAVLLEENKRPGILVSNKFDLSVQRFTLAHELGHILLGHEESSYDLSLDFSGQLGDDSKTSIQELSANTFASELLGHRSAILKSAQLHNWKRKDLNQPEVVYQLSLRLGMSYEATCWALAAQNILTFSQAKKLKDNTVKSIKLNINASKPLNNPWSNIWRITKKESELYFESGPDDIYQIELPETPSSGYIWKLSNQDSRLEIFEEQSIQEKGNETFGSQLTRIVKLKILEPGIHTLSFTRSRPWNDQTVDEFKITVNNFGKEQNGYSRTKRQLLVSQAA